MTEDLSGVSTPDLLKDLQNQLEGRKVHSEMNDAMKVAVDALVRAETAKKFMVAVWVVEEGKLVLATRTTWDFPKASFEESVQLLKDNLEREFRPLDRTPLPRAKFGIVQEEPEVKDDVTPAESKVLEEQCNG